MEPGLVNINFRTLEVFRGNKPNFMLHIWLEIGFLRGYKYFILVGKHGFVEMLRKETK